MIAVRISEDIEKRLERLAKKTGRTKTFYVREAVIEYISDLEDRYLAEEEMRKIKAGAKTYSIDEVRNELGLDD